MLNALQPPLAQRACCGGMARPSCLLPTTVSSPLSYHENFVQCKGLFVFDTKIVQLIPYADQIIVLNGDGHLVEKGSFEALNSAQGYVSSLGLKKGDLKKAAEEDAISTEEDLPNKEKGTAQIVSVQSAKEVEPNKMTASRGKRNADSLATYVKSMGSSWFGIFCFFTVANIGFRSAQCKFILPSHSSRLKI